MTRAQLIAELNARVISGGSDTTAAGLRAYENQIISSCLNATDDLNVNGGYLGIASGRVDVSFINSATATGKFLRDDGSWAVASGASALASVLAVGNITGGTPILISTGDYLGHATATSPLPVQSKLITHNVGGGATSGDGVGFEIEENSSITGYFKTASARSGYLMKAPTTFEATLRLSTLTANRIFVFPDVAGTFITTGNLSSITGFVKGTVSATAGLIPFGTGTADTVTSSADFNYVGGALGIGATANLGGNVGVDIEGAANSAPTMKVNVTGTTGQATMFAQNATNGAYIQFDAFGSAAAGTIGGLNRTGMTSLRLGAATGGVAMISSEGSFPLVFAVNSTEVARFSAAGNLQVGLTPSSAYKLTVADSSTGNVGMLFENQNNGANAFAFFKVQASTTSANSLLIAQENSGAGYSGVPNASVVDSQAAGGLNLFGSHASGTINFYTGGYTIRASISNAGVLSLASKLNISPNNAYDPITITRGTFSSDFFNAVKTGFTDKTHVGAYNDANGGLAYIGVNSYLDDPGASQEDNTAHQGWLISMDGRANGGMTIWNKAAGGVTLTNYLRVDYLGTLSYINEYSTSATPSIAAGAGAGTGPTVGVTGTNDNGIITVTTGSSPSSNAVIATITFSNSFSFPNGFSVIMGATDTNSATRIAAIYAVRTGASTWDLKINGSGLAPTATFVWSYIIKGN